CFTAVSRSLAIRRKQSFEVRSGLQCSGQATSDCSARHMLLPPRCHHHPRRADIPVVVRRIGIIWRLPLSSGHLGAHPPSTNRTKSAATGLCQRISFLLDPVSPAASRGSYEGYHPCEPVSRASPSGSCIEGS